MDAPGESIYNFGRWSHELWHKLQEYKGTYEAIESFRVAEIPPDCQRALLVADSTYHATARVMLLSASFTATEKHAVFKEASRAINEFGKLMRELLSRINSS